MIHDVTVTPASPATNRVIFVCRNPGLRAVVEPLLGAVETHPSSVEALLAATRGPVHAVVVNLEDVEGAAHDLLAAFQRTRPNVPVYALVEPADEPLGRCLLGEGAANYFVLPGDVHRLPQVLRPRWKGPSAAPVEEAAPPAPGAEARREWFIAAIALTELATAKSHDLFSDGARLIFRAVGARGGCAFRWNAKTGRMGPAATFGENAWQGTGDFRAARAVAERALKTGEILHVAPGGPEAPQGGLMCVPVREANETFGAVCVWGKTDGSTLGRGDQEAAEALVRALGRLYRSALEREKHSPPAGAG